jgi:hypothetical protein
MAVGQISGPLLKSNLIRNGVDLAFDTDLLYLDVNDRKIGVKTNTPTHALTVNGTTKTTYLTVDNQLKVGDNTTYLTVTNNSITSTNGTISINPSGVNPVVYNGLLRAGDLTISDNVISSLTAGTDITIDPAGTGDVNVNSNLEIYGDLHITGIITATGTINSENVTLAGGIDGDALPSITDTYDLGRSDKRWNNAYINTINADDVVTSSLTVGGIDLAFRPGNTIYVSAYGDNANSGTHQNDPYGSIKYALTQATTGTTIVIYPGIYTEIFPMTVPAGVTVRGSGIRSVIIKPTLSSNDKDAFLLNGETCIEDLTIIDFFYNSGTNTGHAFRFVSGMTVTSKSPYIRNVSVITKGSVTSPSDVLGFAAGDAGRGALLDGSVVSPSSKEATCLFHAATFITPNADAITMTNGVRVEWLNSFTYYANYGLKGLTGSTGFANVGKTSIRVSSTTGTFSSGQTLTSYASDGTTILAQGVISSVDGNKIFLTGKVAGLVSKADANGKTVTIQGNAQLSTAIKKFGTSSLLLDGTGDYLTVPSNPEFAFPSTISRLAKTITVNGNAAVSATQSKFGGSSIAFDGTGDYLSIATDTDYGFGTGDFTIEGWFYKTAVATQYLFDTRTTLNENSVAVQSNGSGSLRLFVNGVFVLTSSNAHTNNAWNHLAISRAGGVTRFFINGVVSTNTYTDTTNYGTTKPLAVGAQYNGTTAFAGYIDDFRVSNTARYTATFTPTTTEFVDDYNTKLLINGNSTIVDSASYGIATNFTIEGWIYRTADTGTSQTLFDFRTASSQVVPNIFLSATYVPGYLVNGSQVIIGSTPIPLNTWTHIAVSRSGTSTKLFVNGIQIGSTYPDANNYIQAPVTIGAGFDGTTAFNGRIDEVRISKGIAKYTTTFAVQTSEFVKTADTVLLLHLNGTDGSTAIEDDSFILQDIRTLTGTARYIEMVDYSDFGAEVRAMASANVYGNYGVSGDGKGIVMYLIGHNFAYIGSGKDGSNDISTVIQAQEVVETNGAYIYFNSVDQRGDFRVGDLFYVNQETGQVQFTSSNINITSSSGVTLTDGTNTTTIEATQVKTGDIKISGSTIETLTTNLNIVSAGDQINLENNVSITGDLNVGGNVTIGGNIVIGDQPTDSISFVAGITSDLIPSGNFNLGSTTKRWDTLYTNSLTVDTLQLTGSTIQSTTTNSPLTLAATGAGVIKFENFEIYNNELRSTSNENFVIKPNGVGIVYIDSNQSIRIPSGTSGQRGAQTGGIRYNSETTHFEGYNGTAWVILDGVYDTDLNTYITAELTPGANDNVIRFYSNNVLIADINSTRLRADKFEVDQLVLDNNTISTTTTDTSISVQTTGTGSVNIENFAFRNNVITGTTNNAILTFQQTGEGYVKFEGTGGIVIPYGLTPDRPSVSEIGMVRYNTSDKRVEVFNGSTWINSAGESTANVTVGEAQELSIQYVLTLG